MSNDYFTWSRQLLAHFIWKEVLCCRFCPSACKPSWRLCTALWILDASRSGSSLLAYCVVESFVALLSNFCHPSEETSSLRSKESFEDQGRQHFPSYSVHSPTYALEPHTDLLSASLQSSLHMTQSLSSILVKSRGIFDNKDVIRVDLRLSD